MAKIGDVFIDPEFGIACEVVWNGDRGAPLLCGTEGWECAGLRERTSRPAKSVTGRRLTAAAAPSQGSLT